jgi:hypothetical protein
MFQDHLVIDFKDGRRRRKASDESSRLSEPILKKAADESSRLSEPILKKAADESSRLSEPVIGTQG